MADRTKQATEQVIHITPIETAEAVFHVLGTSPLIINRVSQKAQRELLSPHGPKNKAERAQTMKHDPVAEFRASPYLSESPSDPTYLLAPSPWFKAAMKSAALDLPGSSKAQIGRLCYVMGEYVPLYGTPQLLMSIVRSADINHTPDIRSRAILREWCATVTVRWVEPLLNQQAIANLLHAGGTLSGVGDWRQQKGSGSYGQFKLVSDDDADLQRIMKSSGYDPQATAMQTPTAYDSETGELMSWYMTETERRGPSAVVPKVPKA